MKIKIVLLNTVFLFVVLGSASTALPLTLATSAQATPEKPLGEEEVDASTQSADDPITGEWDASAEAQGTTTPFTLKLKLEGDKVTGSSDSDQGRITISKGTWDGNKLTFSLDTPNGAINMNAVLKEGKLVGEFDYLGQFQGKWEAKKK